MRRLIWVLAGFLAVLTVSVVGFLVWAYRPVPAFQPVAYEPTALTVWPTEAWPRSTPDAQGMSSARLLAMADHVNEKIADDPEFFLDAITIVRNGHIVAEIYPNPNYPPNQPHVLHSATKSIVSALIGIAIDRGLIESVDTRLVDIFAGRKIDNLDAKKRAITVGDLLTMQTGLHSRDSYLYGHEGLLALQQSEDWLQFALDLPMAAEPGMRFDYSNISTFLLGGVLTEVTGMDVLRFAREALFNPLGINNVRWERTRDGQPIAWARMWLMPNDLAKIGLLYLQKGRWNGEQIISEAWIEASVTPHAYPKNAVDILNADFTRNREASSQNWVSQRFFRTFSDGYGYQWWLDRAGNYTALGTHGQYLIVSPESNVIVVAFCKCRGLAQFEPAHLFYDFVLPSIQSDTPLPETPEASAALAALATPPAREAVLRGAVEHADIVERISGTTFLLDPNPYNTDNLRFDFNKDMSEVEINYTAREDWTVRYTVGLDGVPRQTENETGSYVAEGTWTAPDTLEVSVEIVGYTTFDGWVFQFGEDELLVTEYSITGTYTYSGRPADR